MPDRPLRRATTKPLPRTQAPTGIVVAAVSERAVAAATEPVIRGMLFAVCCIAALLAATRTHAQEYDFHNLSVGDGLAQSQVYALCPDRRGALWFATRGGGVSCYDGITFTTYTEENGLASNYVRAIVEDGAGTLWFGTDAGLCSYDGRRWRTLPLPSGNDAGMINALLVDSGGVMWIGLEETGLLRYDGHAFRRFSTQDGFPGQSVRALGRDRQGRLYIGTEHGLAIADVDGAGLAHVRAGRAATGVPGCAISAIAAAGNGDMWVATYGCGLCRIAPGGAVEIITVAEGLTNNTIGAVIVDRSGNVWIGTSGGGVVRRDAGGLHVFTETEGLCSNVIVAIVEDNEGNIWFGSSGGGVSRFGGERIVRFTERQGYLGNWVYAIHQDRDGNIWFGSSGGGVTRYDGAIYTRYAGSDGFTAAKVRAIRQGADGTIWFGTVGDGLYSYAGGVFRHVDPAVLQRARFVNAIAEDPRGRIWLATSDGGVLCYDRAGTTRVFRGADGLHSTRVYDVLIDDGAVWAATDGGGVARIALDSAAAPRVRVFTTADGMPNNSVRSIARDRRGALLFGTGGGGIGVYTGGAFRVLSRKTGGLPSNNVYAVVADPEGRIWMGSEKGLARITVDSAYRVRALRQYGRPEGVIGIEIAQNAVLADRSGNIWFGTIAGAVRYNPRMDAPNMTPPRTHIRDVRLFFTPIAATEFAGTPAPWYPIPDRLELPFDQNSLSFDVVGICLRNPDRVEYQWMLEGFDAGWSPRTTQTTAVFSNLPPGTYTFRVRSYNEEGVVDPVGAAFRFVIAPPFWRTWWFTTIAAVLIGGGIAAAVLAWMRRVRRAAERERRDAERERAELALRGSVLELQQQALRLSMNPHFLFNALNSIQGLVTSGDVAEAKRTIARFGRLMRGLIDNTRHERVTIAGECDMLRDYMELEKIASGSRFDYEITVDPDIDATAVTIPPMFVQPLVENAIIHGLRNLDRVGHVRVAFSRAGAGVVRCVVTDDGVGRVRAAQMRTAPEHESSALAVIAERLAIIGRERGAKTGVEIEDLVDAAGGAAGTRVTIELNAEL